MDTTLITALMSAILASSFATTGYLARRIDKQADRIDKQTERIDEVSDRIGKLSERVARIEGRLAGREEAAA